jgi:hypothetical protein
MTILEADGTVTALNNDDDNQILFVFKTENIQNNFCINQWN